MKQIKIVLLLLVGLLSGCGNEQTPQEQTSVNEAETTVLETKPTAEDLYAEAAQILFQSRKIDATLYGLSEEMVGMRYADLVDDFSPESEKQLRAKLRDITQQIKALNLSDGDVQSVENQQVMASITRYFAGDVNFDIGYIDVWMGLSPFIVNQINGPLIDIPKYMQNDQKVNSVEDAQDYIARLGKFDQLVGSVQKKLSHDVSKRWIPTKVTLRGAENYLKKFMAAKPQEHPFVTALETKLKKVATIDEKQRAELLALAAEKVEKVVYPAYQGVLEQTQALMDKARDESGIWAQPNGDKYYQDAIVQLGDSNLTAEDIHQIGLDEVERISKEMDEILRSQGYSEGSVGARMAQINEEDRFLYPDSKEGRQALLKDLNGYIVEVTKKMAPLFKSKPPYDVEVRSFPVETQDGAPGGQYTSPAIDGSKPGIYWINLRDMKANPTFSLKTLTYHEANPGHHWQVALNLAQDDLPFLRRIAPYNAYVEGWALYSEKVAAEIGMYEDDPFGDLGRLQAEIFRAVRLVVDTGMHYKKWTREQAITYMLEKTGSAESDVTAEIERYMTWPGQALGYKMGMLKILELREKAKTTLGDKFDVAAFHDLVLLGGAVPMTVLETKVNEWVESQK
ncbi:MAG: DUF885 domain-containing protein [Gammaproteobacteria bacterium]|nr:DUF885 domain-containing protein [Gammaproteobacteria bacterium]